MRPTNSLRKATYEAVVPCAARETSRRWPPKVEWISRTDRRTSRASGAAGGYGAVPGARAFRLVTTQGWGRGLGLLLSPACAYLVMTASSVGSKGVLSRVLARPPPALLGRSQPSLRATSLHARLHQGVDVLRVAAHHLSVLLRVGRALGAQEEVTGIWPDAVYF